MIELKPRDDLFVEWLQAHDTKPLESEFQFNLDALLFCFYRASLVQFHKHKILVIHVKRNFNSILTNNMHFITSNYFIMNNIIV